MFLRMDLPADLTLCALTVARNGARNALFASRNCLQRSTTLSSNSTECCTKKSIRLVHTFTSPGLISNVLALQARLTNAFYLHGAVNVMIPI